MHNIQNLIIKLSHVMKEMKYKETSEYSKKFRIFVTLLLVYSKSVSSIEYKNVVDYLSIVYYRKVSFAHCIIPPPALY